MAESSSGAWRQAPQVAASEGSLPQARVLARPEAPVLTGYTRRLLHVKDANLLGVFTYSGAGAANWLFLIDIADGSSQRYDVPNGERGSHGAAMGADGNIYTVTHEEHIYRFLVPQRRWEKLAAQVPRGERAWDAIGAPNGRIYFGTYPGACFGEYDIATGELFVARQVQPDAKYIFDFHALCDGRIRCMSIGDSKHEHIFDPRTRAFQSRCIDGEQPAGLPRLLSDPVEDSLPPVTLPDGDDRVVTVSMPDGRRFALVTPSGRLMSVDNCGGLSPAIQGPVGPDAYKVAVTDGNTICAVGMTGRFVRFDLAGSKALTSQIDNLSSAGNPCHWFQVPSARWAVGGQYSQQNVFRVDLDSGKWDASPTMIARMTGEPCASVCMGGKVYLGIYVNALMMEYDPDRPFAYGVNPRELLQVGHSQSRPHGMAADGRRVFMGSWADYTLLGGTMTVYDTRTGAAQRYPDLIRGHNLDAMTFDSRTGHIFGGTYRWGDQKSHTPVHPAAVAYRWDPDSGKVVRQAAPWTDADMIQVAAVLPAGERGGIVVAVNGNDAALLDADSLETLWRGPFPLGALRTVCTGRDGATYGLAGGKIFRWDLAANRLHALADAPGGLWLGAPAPGRFIVGTASAVLRLDMHE